MARTGGSPAWRRKICMSRRRTRKKEAKAAVQEGPIDLARYTGLWYELARTPNSFQDNTPNRSGKRFSACAATTAVYAARDEGSISIRNSCMRRANDGTTREDAIDGVGKIAGNGGRQLKIAFGPKPARFFQRLVTFGGADYWIYYVGESGPAAPYEWAVVSGPKRDFLYLLTRERFPSAQVRDQALGAARRAGLPVERLRFKQE